MSGPRHLWSGDWQRESEAASAARADTAAPNSSAEADAADVADAESSRQRRAIARLSRTQLILGAGLVLVLAGAAFGASTLLTSSTPQHRPSAQASAATGTSTQPKTGTSTQPKFPSLGTTPPSGVYQVPQPAQPVHPAQPSHPSQPPQTSTTTVAAGPQVSWLGMKIETLPPGVAVIQTVRIGSAADRARINPGEAIIALDGHAVNSAQDIIRLTRGMPEGRQVTLQLSYGSSTSQATVTLGQPPSVTP